MDRYEYRCLLRKTEYQIEAEGVAVLETELGNVVTWFIPFESMSWDYTINSLSRPRLLWWGIPLLVVSICLLSTGKIPDGLVLGIIAAALIAFWKRSCSTFATFKAVPDSLTIDFAPSRRGFFEDFIIVLRQAKLQQVDRAIRFIVDELKGNAESYVRWLVSRGLLNEETAEEIVDRLKREMERNPIGFQQAML
jgi:hypothetical protein